MEVVGTGWWLMHKLKEVQAPNSGTLSAPHFIAFYCARVAPLASPLSLVCPFLSRSSSDRSLASQALF